ncbi:hypothetical protein KKC97_08165 [bacterium]|nr:hypothetical protein [bacterium]MBU1637623.1 hypothetical protein [bacterium]RQV93943.1 MAG: hypothetical protein EH220_07805 [bacterium]
MKRHSHAIALILAALLLGMTGCDEGINDYNSSAKISGYVLESTSNPAGIPGVKVIIESDEDSETPYLGPDRWFETDESGYFEGFIFLGADEDDPAEYTYVADLSVGYFMESGSFSWDGGITVGPGSHFMLPTVYRTWFGQNSGDSGQ